MSKIDEKYINNLQKFTDALEGLVEQLKEQQKEGTEDAVNEMLKNVPDRLDIIITNQQEIKAKQEAIHKDTQQILSEIKELRKSEETGMFDKISNVDNRRKVVDAVKSIILIAGAVLAIGMAFKLVGYVDFASVVGLSLSILIMVEAFKKISDMNIGVTDMIFAGLMIMLVAGSLLAASFILSKVPEITLMQGLTIVVVAGAVGLATWLLMKSIDKVNLKRDWAKILLIPVWMPLVAAGIWLSSYILANVQPITWQQALSIAVIGAAIGIATFALGFALKGMRGVTWKEILAIPLVIPLVAGGLVAASYLFQYVQPIQDPIGLLKTALVTGLAILIFTPALIFIGKFIGKSWQALAIGALGIIAIAGAILAVSWIFQVLPDDMKYPELKWALNVGLGMLLFLPTMLVVGAVGMTGVGIGVLAIGLVGLPLIALSMVAVSRILAEGDWNNNYPSLRWGIGVGTALLLFGMATILAAPAGLVSGIFSFFGGEDPLVKLAKSMLAVGEILSQGKEYWKEGLYPPPKWALGVGTSLYMLAGAFAIISLIEGVGSLFGGELDFNAFVVMAATSMLTASQILARGDWKVAYPTKEWSEGVGTALFMFAKAFAIISLVEGIGNLLGGDLDFNSFVVMASISMTQASQLLQGGLWNTGYPTKEWSEGVGLALSYFAKSFATISAVEGLGGIMSKLFGTKEFNFGDFVKEASQSMVDASHKLKEGDWTSNYPSEEYVKGIGGLLVVMAEAYKKVNDTGFMDILGAIFGGGGKKMELAEFVETSASSISKASLLLNEGVYDKVPTEMYMGKFGSFVDAFAEIIDDFDQEQEDMDNFNYLLNNVLPNIGNLSDFPNIDPFVENVNKFSEVINKLPDDKYKAINRLTDSIKDFSKALDDINLEAVDKLSAISQGVMLVSIIDEEKLRGVLDAISEKEDALKEIYGDEEKKNIFEKAGSFFGNLIGGKEEKEDKTETTTITSEGRDLDKEEFYSNIAAIKGMLQNMMDIMDSPGHSGNFNK